MHQERRAVVIDDDILLCRLLQRRLHKVNIELFFAHTGNSGSAMVSRIKPDVILLDVHLPDTNGFDVCRELRSQPETRDIPIIMMTASGDLHARAFSAGATDCIIKPISGEELNARVAHVLDATSHAQTESTDCTDTPVTTQAEESLAAIDEVLAVIGHELRTPLSGIRVMAEYLITEQGRSGPPHRFLVSIHDQILRMSTMVNNLLESARINSGMARWSWSSCSLDKICTGAMDILDPVVEGAIVPTCQVEPAGLTMRGDADAVQRLLINLISNALKYTNSGHIAIDVRGETDSRGQWIVIQVRDTGKGMSSDVLTRLGVPFALNKGVIGLGESIGCGLGISICKTIAAVHGGDVSFASEPGKGTFVTVRLRADLDGPAWESHSELESERVAA